MFLKDYLERTIREYENLLSKNNFQSEVDKEETQKVVDILRDQLIKINERAGNYNEDNESENGGDE